MIEYLELKKRLAVIKEEIQEILKKYDYNSYEYSMQNKLMEVLSVLYELRKSVSVWEWIINYLTLSSHV